MGLPLLKQPCWIFYFNHPICLQAKSTADSRGLPQQLDAKEEVTRSQLTEVDAMVWTLKEASHATRCGWGRLSTTLPGLSYPFRVVSSAADYSSYAPEGL